VGALSGKIEREIAAVFGIKPAVLLRTPKELATIAERNPYPSTPPRITYLSTHPIVNRRPDPS